MISSLTKIDTPLKMLGTTLAWFSSFEKFSHGVLCINVSECKCMCNMNVVRGEVQVEQLMTDSIINLRKQGKYHKNKLTLVENQDSASNTR